MTTPRNDRSRPVREAASLSADTTIPELDHWLRRVLTDALHEGRRQWWLKRAEDFERAKPEVGDFHGNAAREDLRARWLWLDDIARACRNKASVAPLNDVDPDVNNVWREAS